MANKYDPKINHRRGIRLKGYDYTRAGAYFVTVVAYQRECLFGDVVDGEMMLNKYGLIVAEKWQWLENQYPYVTSGTSVVMPNHFHGILVIDFGGRGGSRIVPDRGNRPYGIGKTKTIRSVDRCIQNGFHKTNQFVAQHPRSPRLAAELL